MYKIGTQLKNKENKIYYVVATDELNKMYLLAETLDGQNTAPLSESQVSISLELAD